PGAGPRPRSAAAPTGHGSAPAQDRGPWHGPPRDGAPAVVIEPAIPTRWPRPPSKPILCGSSATVAERERCEEAERADERLEFVAGEALEQRCRERARQHRRDEARLHGAPPRALREDLAPPGPPARQRLGADAEELTEPGGAPRRGPLAERRRQHHDRAEVHLASEKAHRRRGRALAAIGAGAAEAQSPVALGVDVRGAAARLAWERRAV